MATVARPRARSATAGARWAVVAGPVLMLALGFHRLGEESLWADEGITAAAIARDPGEFAAYVLERRPTHGLYYALLYGWSALGTSEAALRSLSVLCMAAAAGLVAVLAARLFGPRAALPAGVLFAVNPFVLRYAQEARMYALVTALAVAATVLLVRALERPSTWRWVAWAAVSALMVYAQATAGAVLVAHAVAAWLHPRRPGRPALAGLVVVGLALAPLALLAARAGPEGVEWIRPPSPERVLLALVALGGGSALPVAMIAALAGFGVAAARRRGAPPTGRWGVALALLLVVSPFAVALLVSLATPLFVPRYLIVAIPGIVLLAAAGIAHLPPRWAPAAATGLVAAACAPGIWGWYAQPQREDWRGAAAIVAARAQRDDTVVVRPRWARGAFDYYHSRLPTPTDDGTARSGRGEGSPAVWVVATTRRPRPAAPRLHARLAEQYRDVRRWRRFRVAVWRYSHPMGS